MVEQVDTTQEDNEIVQQQIEQAQSEVDIYERKLDQLLKNRSAMLEQWELEKKIWEIRLQDGNQEVLDPKFKYETVPEYQEALLELYRKKYDNELKKAERDIEEFDEQVEKVRERLEESKQRVAELTGDTNE